jgi:DNA polymerase-3 subunit epsilon
MFDWIKNITKESPPFWKNYLSKFDKKPSKRFVVLSTETTGLNPKKDLILSIGAIGIENDSIHVGDSYEVIISQKETISKEDSQNEFLIHTQQKKVTETRAIQNFIKYLGNAVLVGHRVNFDIEMINESLEKLGCGRLKNEALDIEVMYKKLHDINDKNFTLEDLGTLFKIPKAERVSTADDAYTIALLFLKLKSRLGIK